MTPLLLAAKYNTADVVTKLIEAGANIEAKDQNQITPLMLAAEHNTADVVTKLIVAGANIEAKNNQQRTPLLLAADHNTADVVSRLIEAGADVHAKDNFGDNALSRAERNEEYGAAIIKLLRPLLSIKNKND